MEEFEVVIVGGGPSGSATALALQRLNRDLAGRTLILDRKKHPREKICGGGVSANAQKLLKELDFQIEVPHVDVDIVRMKYGERIVRIPEKGLYAIVRRDEFDASLLNFAREKGVEARDGEELQDLNIHVGREVELRTNRREYEAKVVVGADGVGSLIRRRGGFSHGKKVSRLCLVETPVDEDETPEFMENAVTVDFSYVPQGLHGYAWNVPCWISGKPNLSRGVYDRVPGNPHECDIRGFLERVLARDGIEMGQHRVKSYPIREFDPRGEFSKPHIILVGDAAGIDPLMAEGIAEGIEYGMLAAEEIKRGLEKGKFTFDGYRARILRSRLGRELSTYLSIADRLYGKECEFWLSLLCSNPLLGQSLTKSFAGRLDLHKERWHLLASVTKSKIRSMLVPKKRRGAIRLTN